MRRTLPFLLVGVLLVLTIGAAVVATVTKRSTPPASGIEASCVVLTPHEASELLGGPVTGPPLSPFLSPICWYSRGNARVAVRMVKQAVIARDIKAIFIDGRLPLTCTALSQPPNCRLPALHHERVKGQVVAWLDDPANPGANGLAVVVKGGVVIQVSAVHVTDVRKVVLGGMGDVLRNY